MYLYRKLEAPHSLGLMLIDNGVGMNYNALVDMCMWGHEMRDDAGQTIGNASVLILSRGKCAYGFWGDVHVRLGT